METSSPSSQSPVPLERLLSLMAVNASGELICAAEVAETHVFLQKGKIAWATDSEHPFAFAEQLRKDAEIDPQAFREVVEECRKSKLPLGETLVQWGVAGLDVVRSALLHQISEAISLLGKSAAGQLVFLQRAYRPYDDRLVFTLDEVTVKPAPSRPVPAAPVSAGQDLGQLGLQLFERVEGIESVEIFHGPERARSAPTELAHGVPRAILEYTLLDGADFAAFRLAHHNLLGVTLADERSVWCTTRTDTTFGAIVAALGESVGTVPPTPPPRLDLSRERQRLGTGDGPLASTVRAFTEKREGLLGALVLGPELAVRTGIGHGAEKLAEHARRRGRCFSPEAWKPSAEGFELHTLVTREDGLWCFGSELPSSETLWIFLPQTESQGLGWAYLATLARAIHGIG